MDGRASWSAPTCFGQLLPSVRFPACAMRGLLRRISRIVETNARAQAKIDAVVAALGALGQTSMQVASRRSDLGARRCAMQVSAQGHLRSSAQ